MSHDTTALRRRYAQRLVAAGHPLSPQWWKAFASVPRHMFVPCFFHQGPTGRWEAVDASDRRWLELIYSDMSLVTQLDGDDSRWAEAVTTSVVGVPTSSSSQPSLMATMLEALDVREGHRVLEIGTGTGYQAALLCHRLGSHLVTTIDIDPHICARAVEALHRCGHTPTTIVGDGDDGYPAGAPYDRIIATCSVASIPAAWIAQTRPGGLILASLYRDLGGGPLVRLTVTDEGAAEGRFLPSYGAFMPVRARPALDAPRLLPDALRAGDEGRARPTDLDAHVLEHPDFGMLAALMIENVGWVGFEPPGAGYQLWLLDDEGSTACLHVASATVTQRGRRQLWDELESAYDTWERAGRPTRDRFGLTVSADGGHCYWLDNPATLLWTEPDGAGHDGTEATRT